MRDNITDLHFDVLQELGNIGAGNAATALAHLVNKKINIQLPKARVLTLDEMKEMLGDTDIQVASVSVVIEGDVEGRMLLVLLQDQMELYIQKMIGASNCPIDDLDDEFLHSALKELGNILIGSYLSSLADFTKLSLNLSVPNLLIDIFSNVISNGFREIDDKNRDYGIVIEAALNEESESPTESITGYLLLIPEPSFLKIIFHSLGVPFDDE